MSWMIGVGILSMFSVVVLSVIVLHPEIKEGLLIKTSLITIIFSLLITAGLIFSEGETASVAYWRAGFLLRVGLGLLCIGIIHRANVIGKIRRKKESDIRFHNRTRSILMMMQDQVDDLAFMFKHDREELEDKAKHG